MLGKIGRSEEHRAIVASISPAASLVVPCVHLPPHRCQSAFMRAGARSLEGQTAIGFAFAYRGGGIIRLSTSRANSRSLRSDIALRGKLPALAAADIILPRRPRLRDFIHGSFWQGGVAESYCGTTHPFLLSGRPFIGWMSRRNQPSLGITDSTADPGHDRRRQRRSDDMHMPNCSVLPLPLATPIYQNWWRGHENRNGCIAAGTTLHHFLGRGRADVLIYAHRWRSFSYVKKNALGRNKLSSATACRVGPCVVLALRRQGPKPRLWNVPTLASLIFCAFRRC